MRLMTRKETLIKELSLQPHPEGGYYAETYRCESEMDNLPGINGPRNFSTAIYYLLGSEDVSHFHRIASDEVWHHYEGSSITIHMIHDDGLYEAAGLGKLIEKGQEPQLVVPAGSWFGVTVDEAASYTLCGCTVSPGFDFRDFEMADRNMMLQAFPDQETIIKKLTA